MGTLADESGQALVEFALVLPLLLLVTMGIVDFGRAWNVRQVVTDAAREAARTMVATSASQSQLLQVVNTAFAGAGMNQATVQEIASTATCPAPVLPATAPIVCLSNWGGNPNTPARVSIVYPYRLEFVGRLMGLITQGQQTLILRSTFVMRHE